MMELENPRFGFEVKMSAFSRRAKELVDQRERYLAGSKLIIDPDPVWPTSSYEEDYYFD